MFMTTQTLPVKPRNVMCDMKTSQRSPIAMLVKCSLIILSSAMVSVTCYRAYEGRRNSSVRTMPHGEASTLVSLDEHSGSTGFPYNNHSPRNLLYTETSSGGTSSQYDRNNSTEGTTIPSTVKVKVKPTDSPEVWNCSRRLRPDSDVRVCEQTDWSTGSNKETSRLAADDTCGSGAFSVKGRCYWLLASTDQMTSYQAHDHCSRLGSHLVSFNTEDEYRSVFQVLFGGGSKFSFHIGLRSAFSGLPFMYLKSLQWADDTIAYNHFTAIYPSYENFPACGFFCLNKYWYRDLIVLTKCHYPGPKRLLCELSPRHSIHGKESRIQLPTVSSTSFRFSAVTCPDGRYVTHAFLACDVKMACWGDQDMTFRRTSDNWDLPEVTSCRAPLTSLPPSFACREGFQRVPYTLLCDHRRDCYDGSDEDFCVFPACTVQIACGTSNKQCCEAEKICDGHQDCVNGADEFQCLIRPQVASGLRGDRPRQFLPPPAVVEFSPSWNRTHRPVSSGLTDSGNTHSTRSVNDALDDGGVTTNNDDERSYVETSSQVIATDGSAQQANNNNTQSRWSLPEESDHIFSGLRHNKTPHSNYASEAGVLANDGSDQITSLTYESDIPVSSLDTTPDTTNNVSFYDENGSQCPETHFQCPGNGYCLPVFVLCNGVPDCPGKEDEVNCTSFTCPGYYRCRSCHVCLHPVYVCDGVAHCPEQDDELLCRHACPLECLCHGLAFVCSHPFEVNEYPSLRYLNARGSGLTLAQLSNHTMLVHLELSHCGLADVDIVELPNVNSLDLSDNFLKHFEHKHLEQFPNLHVLTLRNNPALAIFSCSEQAGVSFPLLNSLDLANVKLPSLDADAFIVFPDLKSLNLSGCEILTVTKDNSQSLAALSDVDLRGSPLFTFPKNVFKQSSQLHSILADTFKMCCHHTLPVGFNPNNCLAPVDEVSSCEDLLRSASYRVVLSLFAILALLGNACCFIERAFVEKQEKVSGFSVFVLHLCVSDFLMGLYLAIIGIADRVYQGNYLWEGDKWRLSAPCKGAGFISLLSCEASAFIICLITLDRFLVLRFPFSQMHFCQRSAQLACCLVWTTCIFITVLPLLPWVSHWQFYGASGLCVPLPLQRRASQTAGSKYSFGIVIILNFVLFLLIAVGQAFIYMSVRANSMSVTDSTRKAQSVNIARRLFTVAVTDFLCWFPICVLGLLTDQDIPIPGEVNVSLVIFVLPLNSTANPFIYTMKVVLERRRNNTEQRLLKQLQTSLKD